MKRTSDAQTKANRENSKRSTGPKTAEGKRKVSLNPMIHGFAGQTCFVPDHQKDAYANHFAAFRDQYKPKGPTEEFMVQSLADLSWSTQQIRAITTNLISLLGTKASPFPSEDSDLDFNLAQAANLSASLKEINLLGVYEQRKTRLFNSTLRELQQLQTTRRLAEQEELEEASEIRKACKTTYPKWDPAQDGFACSLQEIDRHIARANRLNDLKRGFQVAC